jgi:hypothetical protein
MHKFSRSLAVLALAALLPLSAHAAPRMGHATLHSSIKNMGFPRVMATATLTYAKPDVTISFHASHLPRPSVLHEKVYVLWATDGAMKDRVGVLTVSRGAGMLTGKVMMSKVVDLVVTANKTATAKMGKTVLSGMVGK